MPLTATEACLRPVEMLSWLSLGLGTPLRQTRGAVYMTLSGQYSLTSACSASDIFLTSILTWEPWRRNSFTLAGHVWNRLFLRATPRHDLPLMNIWPGINFANRH